MNSKHPNPSLINNTLTAMHPKNLKYLLLLPAWVATTACMTAASFDSGSDGSDGPLSFPSDMGDVIFDPDNFDPALDVDRDGIYNFTTITIGSGTRLILRGDLLGQKPLIWLASGDIAIDGELDLSANQTPGVPGVPGVGGFPGGIPGGIENGQGPDGTAAATEPSNPSGNSLNPYLMPLIGASGKGRNLNQNSAGASGAGAALIASSGKISILGSIYAFDEYQGGNIRLVANEVQMPVMHIYGANILRIEAFIHTYFDTPQAQTFVKTRPGALFPTSPIKISMIDAVPVDQTKPGANKGEPDAIINNGNPVTLLIECTGIPLNSSIIVVGWNDTVGKVEALTGPLSGTVQSSATTCEMIIPTGDTTFMAQVVSPL
jgi:hypothetical protein